MGKEQGCGNRLQEAWEEVLHKENGGGRKAKTEGLFEKLQKDLKPGNCLVMAKITFSLFLRQPECHRGSTGGMSNTQGDPRDPGAVGTAGQMTLCSWPLLAPRTEHESSLGHKGDAVWEETLSSAAFRSCGVRLMKV